MKIIKMSAYDQYTFKAETQNWSYLFDKIVRIAAKVTESYAGDIFFCLDGLKENERQQQKQETIRLFAFRENGVERIDIPAQEHIWADFEQHCSIIILNDEAERAQEKHRNNARDVFVVDEIANIKLGCVLPMTIQLWALFPLENGGAVLVRVNAKP